MPKEASKNAVKKWQNDLNKNWNWIQCEEKGVTDHHISLKCRNVLYTFEILLITPFTIVKLETVRKWLHDILFGNHG